MALFEYFCPVCNRTTLLDPDGACQNIVGSGLRCGFTFPLRFGSGNSKVRGKVEKHTSPRPSGVMDDYSWVDESGQYPLYQIAAARSDSVHLDPQEKYLFLFCAPSGDAAIAKLMFGTGTDVCTASGIVLPLNSRLQNMHVHFDNYQNRFIPVAEGTGLTIQQPNVSHPTEYHVLSGAAIVCRYDCATNTLYK